VIQRFHSRPNALPRTSSGISWHPTPFSGRPNEGTTSRRSRPALASLIHPNHTPIAPAARLSVRQEDKIAMRPILNSITILVGTVLSCCAPNSKFPAENAQPAQAEQSGSLRWTRTDGPDFVVYQGKQIPPESGGAGYYSGFYPSFEPDKKCTKHNGKLGDYKVVWYRFRRTDGKFHQQCLISGSNSIKLHAWVFSNSQDELPALVTELGHRQIFHSNAR